MTARGLLAVIVALLLCACSANGGQPSTGGQGYVGTSKELLTQVPPDKRVNAPVLSGPLLGSAKTASTSDHAGKVVVVNVWGSWCGPCRQEAPDLQQASMETGKVAQFLGINSRDLNPAPAEAFVRANKITYPSIYDPDGRVLLALAGTLPLSTLPSTLVLDRQGRIAARVTGRISKITLVNLIEDVAAGK